MYVTADDIISRLGATRAVQLTADSGTTADSAMITGIIDQVEGEVNGMVRKRSASTVTLADYPDTFHWLAGMVTAIAIYRLALRRPPVPADWKQASDKALETLTALVAGETDFPDADLNGSTGEWGSVPADASRENMV